MRTAKTLCPRCGYEVDGATVITQQKEVAPEPGDISLCLNCGGLNEFSPSLSLLKVPRDRELDILHGPNGALIREAQLLIAGKPHL